MRKQLSIAIVVVFTITAIVATVANANHEVELHQIEVETKEQVIENLQQELEDSKVKEGDSQETIDKKNKKIKELEKSVEELQAKKAEEARIAAEQARNAVVASPEPVQPTPAPAGSCADWMAAAGITDPATAHVLIMRESGCNPNAVNASSGACGIGQQLPCGKWPHAWNDPIGGMIDMQNYVMGRYGSWGAALGHSNSVGWY